MKILVTGAAGYIGSNITEDLLASGNQVIGIDNFNDYYNPKFKEYNIKDFKDNFNFTLYREDLLDAPKLAEIFEKEKPEAIVHMAAWAGVTPSIEKPVVYVRNNIEVTVNLAELAVKHNIKSFILASTSSIYGDNFVPFTEDMNTDHPLAPYPATKKACEVMLSTYSRNFDLNVTVFRLFNPLGPRVRPDLALVKLIRSALWGEEFPIYWEDPSKTGRDYTYIGHLLDAVNYACHNPFKYEIFNIGNSEPITLDKLIAAVEDVVGNKANIKQMPARKGEMVTTYADISKAREMLNYNPTTSITETIKIYYDWFKDQDDWYKKEQV